jgi:2,3-bisphosphoglycerate-dependent phosphoglycerate mutase
MGRIGRFLGDLPLRWNGQRVLVIGHVVTRRGLDHFIGGASLEDLVEQDFAWQQGWEYRVN